MKKQQPITIKETVDEKISVEVNDTGIGIKDEYLAELFDPFSQEQTGYTRKYDGSGLGMSILKKFCEMNNGTIEVKSKKDAGSTFTVTFDKYKEE